MAVRVFTVGDSILTYSPDGTIVYGSRWGVRRDRVGDRRLKVAKSCVHRRSTSYSLVQTLAVAAGGSIV